ncbi:MAG TPA: phosphotransferase [Humisphaera sp.]|jgi:aminoglycoside phosphotransferase (APT) family kinase protein|nr:phosphotransferase [Humisphaera sp.]
MASALDIEDIPSLLQYLRASHRISTNEQPKITLLAGGVSNRTVLVERPTGESWVLKQALEKLRVKADWFSDPRRIEREALGMQRLAEFAPPGAITRLIFLDPQHHLLAMEAVPKPHENWKSLLLAGQIDSNHVRQFANLLGIIHRKGWEQRDRFASEFEDRSFFESLRLEPYYLYSVQQRPGAAAFLHRLVEQTRATRYTLVHGDYSPKNILIHDSRLILLDHEVIHFGDGAFDIGFSMAHLLSKAHHLSQWRIKFIDAAKQYWTTYFEAIGDVPWRGEFEPRAVSHTLACLLARCIGRSPLEYLSEPAKSTQAAVVEQMMIALPSSGMVELIDRFEASLD